MRETTRAGDALLRVADVAALTIAAPVALAVTQLGADPQTASGEGAGAVHAESPDR